MLWSRVSGSRKQALKSKLLLRFGTSAGQVGEEMLWNDDLSDSEQQLLDEDTGNLTPARLSIVPNISVSKAGLHEILTHCQCRSGCA